MIRNKAIVNEENSDAEYWKNKYLALMRNPSNAQNLQSMTEMSQAKPIFEGGNHPMQPLSAISTESFTPSWNSVLTKQLKEQASHLHEAHTELKNLAQ